jgi:4-deoxy-L-threo-5-hexosulose-uronate ketol-isomerase
MDTAALRTAPSSAQGLFADGEIRLIYTHYDRMIVGGAVPAGGHAHARPREGMRHRQHPRPARDGGGQRRRAGHRLGGRRDPRDGEGRRALPRARRGPGDLRGRGAVLPHLRPRPCQPSRRLIRIGDAKHLTTGAPETANHRTIYQFIHPEVMESCQLVLGYTRFTAARSGTPCPPTCTTGGWRRISTSTSPPTPASST